MTAIELIEVLSQVHPQAKVFVSIDLDRDNEGVVGVEWCVQGDRETWGLSEPGTVYLLNYPPTHLSSDESFVPRLLPGELSLKNERLHVT